MSVSNSVKAVRLDWVDLAKGIAMVLIIFAHTMEWLSSQIGVSLYLLPIIYSFHVPLFFFISGFLFSSNKPIKVFAKKTVLSFIVPYVTFACATLLADFVKKNILKSEGDINLLSETKQLFFQNHYDTLWFLLVLMFVEIIAFVICRIKNVKIIAALTVVFAVVAGLYYRFINIKLIWSIDEIFYVLPLFMVGYLVRKSGICEKILIIRYTPIYLLLGVLFGWLNLRLNPNIKFVNMFKCHFGYISLFYLSAIFSILFVLCLCVKMERIKPLNYIGRNSMIYYGFHIIILVFVLHFIMPHFDGSVLRYLVFCIISTGAIISVITLINAIVLKTPLKILIGKSSYYKSATKTDKVKGCVCDGK